MVYIAANNNLEPNSIINLMEMAAIGSTPDVNIVVQITRPPDYKGFYGEWGGTRRFLVTQSDGGLSSGDFQISAARFDAFVTKVAPQLGLTQDQVNQYKRSSNSSKEQEVMKLTVPVIEPQTPLIGLDLQSVEDLGTGVNSGDGATLADFGTWAVQNYPADHYGLIMWDHGGGWSAIATDDTLAPSGIHMPEFQAALDTITQAAGQKFDFIGFDACLMAQLAVSIAIQPYANYQIAAEEIVPGLGWDYTPPVKALVANPDLPVSELAKVQIDAFDTLYSTSQKKASGSYDMGIIDLAQVDIVVKALDEFASAVKASSGNEVKAISTARSNVETFSKIGEASSAADAISSVDLSDFMRLMSNLSTDAGVKQASSNVIKAVSQAVIYHKASKTLPQAHGISIFFPSNANTFIAAADGERYRKEFGELLPSWQSFLDDFYGTANLNAVLSLKVTAVSTTETAGSIYNPPVITYNLHGNNIVGVDAKIVYRVNDTTLVILSAFPIDSTVTTEDGSTINDYPDGESVNDFYWNGKIPRISDGTNSTLVLMTTNTNDEQHGFIQGVYTNQVTGTQSNATLLINLDTYQSSGLWVAQDTSQANSLIAQVFPKPGDTFEPIFETRDATGGNAQLVKSGTILTFSKDPFQVTDTPGPDGTYLVVLEAADAAGGSATDVATINVANVGLDPQWQGFKDLNFGLSFLYPGTWTDASVFRRADGTDELYMTDLTGDFILSAIAYTDVTSLDDAIAKMEDEVNSIEGVQADPPTDLQVGNEPAVGIRYQYVASDGVEITGFAVAVYSSETQQGYLLKIEAPSDQADAAQAILEQAMASSQFFQPPQ